MSIKKFLLYGSLILISVLFVVSRDYSVVYQKNKEPKKPEEIFLVFVGDIMLDRGVESSVNKNFKGDFSFLFQKAGFLKNADILFGNLEGPISNMGKDIGNLYSFRMNPAAISALKEAGFGVLSVANNHAGDWGKTAFDDTILNLRDKEIEPCGEKTEPAVVEKNNLKIGFLCFSDVGPNWLEKKDEELPLLIQDASQKADVLVVSFHFGEEYEKGYNERQEYLGHLAIDNGAKIVIGHHPHVIQDTEFYKDGLIAYSLGNFIFDQNLSEETMRGLVLKIVVSESKIKSIDKKIIKINNFYQPEDEN